MGFALSDMQLVSTAFQPHGAIPRKHTGEGDDVSPPLAWSSPPKGTRSYAVVCHDPDAPLVKPGTYGFVHWVLYNIPASVDELPEGVKEYTQGQNALDAEPDLEPGMTLWKLLAAIEPHLLGMNRLVGTYARE